MFTSPMSTNNTNLPQNTHEWGDFWNGEDLSIYSRDDRALPNQSSRSTNTSTVSLNRGSASFSASQSSFPPPVAPSNLDGMLKLPGMKLQPQTSIDSVASSNPGLRAAEAFVRPSPLATNGSVQKYGFDLRNCVFSFTLTATEPTKQEAPTEIFLPDYHFPPTGTTVDVSGGKWTIDADDVDGETMQMLRWWHGEGEQTITVKGLKRRMQDALEPDEEIGYFAQCRRMLTRMLGLGR